MADDFNWLCPYCEHDVTITSRRFTSARFFSEVESADGTLGIQAAFITCPNEECQHTSVRVTLGRWEWVEAGPLRSGGMAGGSSKQFVEELGGWRLKPWGDARPFPHYVPEAILADYIEARAILELSPKASATLARRALQGIVRDFWKVTAGRLKDEIGAVEKRVGHGVDTETFESLHAVRELGNIGAHPERDINLIVDVEPGEAELLLQAIETLIEDTYIAQEKRKQHKTKMEALRQKKKDERGPKPA